MSGLSGGRRPTPEEIAAAWNHASEVMWERFEEFAVRQAQSLNGVLLRGARAVPIGLSAGGTVQPSVSNGALVGYALRETSGAATATVELRQHNAAGDLLIPIKLAAGATTIMWLAPGGVSYSDGLFVVVTGAVDGSVFLRAGDA